MHSIIIIVNLLKCFNKALKFYIHFMVVFKQEQIQLMFIHQVRLMLMVINPDFKKKDFVEELIMSLASSFRLILFNSNLLITMQAIAIIIIFVMDAHRYYLFLQFLIYFQFFILWVQISQENKVKKGNNQRIIIHSSSSLIICKILFII